MTTATESQKDAPATELVPYIFFFGRCEEALKFYADVFHGTYDLQRIAGGPMAEHFPPELHNNVMHARFTAPGISFMASDGRETKAVDPEAGNIALALEMSDRAEGERVFNALAAGGTVKMPLADAFWGGQFGMIDDRFGNQWMLTTP